MAMVRSLKAQALGRAVMIGALTFFPIIFIASLVMRILIVGAYHNLAQMLWSTLISAVAPTIVFSIVTYAAHRNLYDPNYSKASGIDYSERITLSEPYQKAFARCVASLSSFSKHIILVADPVQGRIEASIVPSHLWEYSWRGSGEKISFRLGSSHEDITEIVVTSRSPLSTAIIGAGRMRKNVARIKSYLQGEVP